MKAFLVKLVKSKAELESAAVMAWFEGFNFSTITREAIDQLVELADIAEDREKIAVIDLFRLIILEESQVEYIVTTHWDVLVRVCVIGQTAISNLRDASSKVIPNYNKVSLQFLCNIFKTETGKRIMKNDLEKGIHLIEFCITSFSSINAPVQKRSALLLQNYLLCCDEERKKDVHNQLEACFRLLDEVLWNKELTDKETLMAILQVEGMAFFKNVDLCFWMEDIYAPRQKETWDSLYERTQH